MRSFFPALLAFALTFALLACSDSSRQATLGVPAQATSGSAADTVDLPETNFYEIQTPHGRMVVRLYDETPLHRDNFKRLAAEHYYDSTTFHRVIRGFMIQGGDPNSRDDDPYNDGTGGPGYTVPAEFRPNLYHKRGALAGAREGDPVNPARASSGSQFYIVQGIPMDSLTLDEVEQHIQSATQDPNFRFTPEQRAVYQTQGGTPHLDQQYTVFGELVEGFDVLNRIASVQTPNAMRAAAPPEVADRPMQDVWMVIRPLPDYQPSN